VTAYCERLDVALTEATTPLLAKLDHQMQHFSERCDEADQALRAGEVERKAGVEALGYKLQAATEAAARAAAVDKWEAAVRLDALERSLGEATDKFVTEVAAVQKTEAEETAVLADRIVVSLFPALLFPDWT